MDVVKFWMKVERYPWILRIFLSNLWQDGHLAKDPSLLGLSLRPSMIKGNILYVAFRPWGKLNLAAKGCKKTVDNESSGIRTFSSIWHRVYWHRKDEEPFVNESETEAGVQNHCLMDALEEIREKGGQVDAVVVVMSVGLTLLSRPKDIGIASALKDFITYKTGYNIFLPPESEK